MDESGKFRDFQQLCQSINAQPSYNSKTALVAQFLTDFKGDPYLLCRFLIAKNDKRVYGLREKQLVKILSRCLSAPLADMVSDLELGDVSETAKTFYSEYGEDIPEASSITLKEVDNFLNELVGLTREDQRFAVFSKYLPKLTPEDLKAVVRIIDHDLRINIGAKFVLEALHPKAYEAWTKSNDLKMIVRRWQNHEFEAELGKAMSFSTGISLMTPVKPMLAKSCKSYPEAQKRAPQGFFSEIKYDGERIQIHKRADKYSCFSRNLKPVMEWKVEAVRDYIPQSTDADSIILDGEILLMDTATREPLPFGTLGVHKKNQFEDATVCVFLFDILYLDGRVLLEEPLETRRQLLEENVTVIPNRIELSERYIIKELDDLEEMMARVMRQGLEGIVIKPLGSAYEPAKRKWLKMKKDYLEGMADSADLVVLGAYYGTGDKGGLKSVFLMGCYCTKTKRWKTVCKAGNGHDDATINSLQHSIPMNKIEKDYSRIPAWLDIHRQHTPDFVVKDPFNSPVWEIEGAQFSESKHHTANKISIRFPRVTRIRDDKDFATHTNLQELEKLANASTDHITAASVKTAARQSRSPKARRGQSTSPMPAEERRILSAPDSPPPDELDLEEEKYGHLLHQVSGSIVELEHGPNDQAKILVHTGTDSGKWGTKGLFSVISDKWTKPAEKFQENHAYGIDSTLGDVQLVKVAKDEDTKAKRFVATLIAQNSRQRHAPLDNFALQTSLSKLCGYALRERASIHVPRFSPQMKNMNWDDVEEMLGQCLASKGVPVYVYTYRSKAKQKKNEPKKIERNSRKRPLEQEESNAKRRKVALDEDEDDSNICSVAPSDTTSPKMEHIFEGIIAVLNGFKGEDKVNVEMVLQELGAQIATKWRTYGDDQTTHLICPLEYFGGVYQHVDMLGGTIVNVNWVYDSVAAKRRLNENDYFHNSDYAKPMSASNSSADVAETNNGGGVEDREEKDPTVVLEKVESVAMDKRSSGSTQPLRPIPSLLDEMLIYLHPGVDDYATLKRYLIAFDADLARKPCSRTDVIVTDDATFARNHRSIPSVSTMWVWDSINNVEVLPLEDYPVK